LEKLDLKDRKILYQLDINSRQSFSKIGKKVGLHKDVVAYRVNRLEENGIIKNYYTVIDTSPLGYIHPRFYLSYQYATPEIKEEIIDYFVKSKYVGFVHEDEGSYELALVMVVDNLPKFNFFWEKTMIKYRDYIAKQIFSLYINENMYRYSFFFDENTTERFDRTKVEVFGGEKRVEIDDLDRKILKLITPNARMPTTEMAKKLNLTAITINNRIKKLMSAGVIKGFKVDVNFSKLGYQFFKADIILKEPKKHSTILKYIETNPNLNHTMKSLGYVDLELMFYLKSANHLHDIMTDLSLKFPDAIKNYTYSSTLKTYKWNYMPEE
jgi:Lrp/AsnC family transcriptional regulator for asnA, asnC and gidA